MLLSLPASLLIDDYFMFLLELIREARLEFSAFFYRVTGQEPRTPSDMVESIYYNMSLIEEQDTVAELQRLWRSVIDLELALLEHLHLLLSTPDVTPLRQNTWHLLLSKKQISHILDMEYRARYLDEMEWWGYDAKQDTAEFGYRSALIIEALYWPLRATHLSSNADQ